MADSSESKTPMWQGMTRRREKDSLLRVIPMDHLVGRSTQGTGTLSSLANAGQSGASAPGADAGGADAGGADAGGAEAGGADCIGGADAARGGAGDAGANPGAVAVHRTGAASRAGGLAAVQATERVLTGDGLDEPVT